MAVCTRAAGRGAAQIHRRRERRLDAEVGGDARRPAVLLAHHRRHHHQHAVDLVALDAGILDRALAGLEREPHGAHALQLAEARGADADDGVCVTELGHGRPQRSSLRFLRLHAERPARRPSHSLSGWILAHLAQLIEARPAGTSAPACHSAANRPERISSSASRMRALEVDVGKAPAARHRAELAGARVEVHLLDDPGVDEVLRRSTRARPTCRAPSARPRADIPPRSSFRWRWSALLRRRARSPAR